MKSKAFHAFEQKLSYFDDDIELIDVLKIAVSRGDLTDPTSQYVMKYIDSSKHSHIVRRKNSDVSREQIINHLRSSIYSSYVKDVYEEVTHYLRTMLKKAAENGFDSARIIGDHPFNVEAKKILELGNWTNVCQMVSDSLFQSLEKEKSTLNLLKKTAKKLALNVDEQLINDALPYLEVRHFLVHSDGKLSQEYIKKYPSIQHDKDGCVILSYTFICNMRSLVKSLICKFDEEVIAKNFLKESDTQP